ncbi:sodium-dependent phosphate transport protein 1-like [Ciona intestinalis]
MTALFYTNSTDLPSNGQGSCGFDWSRKQEGLFLGAAFYGNVASNIPGGLLAKRFGFHRVVGVTVLVASIFQLLTPIAAYWGFSLAIVCRVIIGTMQGAATSALYSCWSSWAPPLERSVLNSISFSGFPLGLAFISLCAGWISETLGWEAVFYITGVVLKFVEMRMNLY